MRLTGDPAAGEDSYRWLMGEDSTAFGGAIRDMWTPTCLGDPGKVTDAEYHCDTSDGGGVHSNSGVPNHGFALLVDGGTYNGQTVTAIGLVEGRAPLLAGAVASTRCRRRTSPTTPMRSSSPART